MEFQFSIGDAERFFEDDEALVNMIQKRFNSLLEMPHYVICETTTRWSCCFNSLLEMHHFSLEEALRGEAYGFNSLLEMHNDFNVVGFDVEGL